MGQTGWKPRKGRTRQSCRRQSPPTFIWDWDGVRKRSLGAARGTIWEAGVSEDQGMEKRLTHLEPVSTWYREWHLGYCCHCLISSLCVFITKVKHVPLSKNSLCLWELNFLPSPRFWPHWGWVTFSYNVGSLFRFWNCKSKDQMAQSEYSKDQGWGVGGEGESHQRCPETKQITSKPHHAIWTSYRTDGALNCLILSAEQRKEMF